MSSESTNPFAAPGVQTLPAAEDHWQLSVLQSGLHLCLISLGIGTTVAILRGIQMLAFGTNATSLWFGILICLKLANIVATIFTAFGCAKLFAAAPKHQPRPLPGAVLLLAIVVPLWNTITPSIFSRLLGIQGIGLDDRRQLRSERCLYAYFSCADAKSCQTL